MDIALRERLDLAVKEMRKDIIKMTYGTGTVGAHIGGSLSVCEIIAVLYLAVMNIDKDNMESPDRDRLVLSKGHTSMAMYAGLKQLGVFDDNDLATYKKNGSKLTVHPTYAPQIGMEFPSGSLGQGLSLGVGMCLGLRQKGNETSRVFVINGDGECNEGSVWEAAAAASHYKLNNIVSIVDMNKLQSDGFTIDILDMQNMTDKWRSFGWETVEVDGHDVEELYNALSIKSDKPICVIANTIKGKGVSFIEGQAEWHNGALSDEQYETAMKEQEGIKC